MDEAIIDIEATEQPNKKFKTEQLDYSVTSHNALTTPYEQQLAVSSDPNTNASNDKHARTVSETSSPNGSPKRVRRPKVFFEPEVGATRKRKSAYDAIFMLFDGD